MATKRTRTVEFLLKEHDRHKSEEGKLHDRLEAVRKKLEEMKDLEKQRDQLFKDRAAATLKKNEFIAMLKEQGIEEHEL